MPERAYAVVVDPERWGGDLDVLARRLGRSMRQKPGVIADMLGRGPVTVDADLRRQEAEMLCRRIARLDVPAAVQTQSGDVVAHGADLVGPAEDDSDGRGGNESGASFSDRGARSDHGGLDGDTGEPAPGGAGADPAGWEAVIGEEAGEPDGGETPGESASSGAWDGEGAQEDDGDAEPSSESAPPALGELVGGEPDGADEGDPGDSAGSTHAASSGPSLPAPDAADEEGGGGDPFGSGDLGGLEANDGEFTNLSDSESPVVDGGWEKTGESDEIDSPESATPPFDTPGSGPPEGGPSEESVDDVPSSEEFDGQRMAEALSDSAETSGRYANAFDDRAEHIPLFGAFLSMLAPGAGQFYNGEEEKARAYARRFVLLRPWWESVRDAKEVGDAIHRGDRPKPEEGNIGRALRHLGTVYAAFFALLLVLWVGVRVTSDWGTSTERGPSRAERRRTAVAEAAGLLQRSRIRARTVVARHERDAGPEDTAASRRRRAAELFRIGYRACERGDYEECDNTMKRVKELDDALQRQAFQLSTWANFQMRMSSSDRPMPDIDMTQAKRRMYEAGLDVGRPPPKDVGTRSDAPSQPTRDVEEGDGGGDASSDGGETERDARDGGAEVEEDGTSKSVDGGEPR